MGNSAWGSPTLHRAHRTVTVFSIAAVLALSVAGCSSTNMFNTHGASAHDIAVLTYEMFAILSVVLITVWSLLAYVIIRFRRRSKSEASRTRGNTTIEVVWFAIPAVIVAILFALTMITTGQLRGGPDTVNLTVTGHQWWWQVKYTGANFETANEIHLPADTDVTADLESADVIHQFSCPEIGGKVQMIPGTTNHITFLPIEPGTYLGVCAQFCGVQHTHMHFLVIVQPPAQFAAWLANQMKLAVQPTGAQAIAGEAAMARLPCASCHTIRGTSLAGTFGPDLTHLASRTSIAAVTLTNTPANLLRWITNPQAIKPGCRMPILALTPQIHAEIVAYLDELK
jgi:cytochrome c oxidase subunit 2